MYFLSWSLASFILLSLSVSLYQVSHVSRISHICLFVADLFHRLYKVLKVGPYYSVYQKSSALQVYAIRLYGYAIYLCLFIDQWTPELLSYFSYC